MGMAAVTMAFPAFHRAPPIRILDACKEAQVAGDQSALPERKRMFMMATCSSLLPRLVLVATLLWFAPDRASAQQSDDFDPADDRVVVTAEPPDPLSPSVEEARARLQPVPGAVNVYGSDDYRLGRHDYLEDLLRYQPGLVISSSQGAEDTHVSSRGSGQNNDDIIGLAILVDGIPINQGDGEAFLHDIDLQGVKYVEVYRGADALLGFRAGYRTQRGFQVYLEAKNLLNKTYAACVEPIADARIGEDNASFSPGLGRAFYGGVSWSW